MLRHENAVLRRHASRIRYEPADRVWFAALARLIPRRRWTEIFPVTPATLLAWHRQAAASRYDMSNSRKPGRPPTVPGIARLVVRLAKENPLGIPPHPRRGDEARPLRRAVHGMGDPACRRHRSGTAPVRPDRRVAPVHCCTGAPSGYCACHSSLHAAQASRLGGSGRLLQHGVSRQPGRMFRPVAGGVYEVCPVAACGAGRVVVDQVVRRDRLLSDPQGWVGPGRPAGITPGGFPRPARRGTRRACLHATGAPRAVSAGRQLGAGGRFRGPWGRDGAAAVAVAVTATLDAPVNTAPL